MARVTLAALKQENEQLRKLVAELQGEVEALRNKPRSTPSALPSREERLAYFAAHPGQRSATPAQIIAYVRQ